MNTDLGKTVTAIVTDQNEKNTFVQKSGNTYRVTTENGLKIGDTIEGFPYIDMDNRLSFSTDIPEVNLDNFGWGEAVEIRRDLGVFVSIGLPNKDILVSIDDLPTIGQLWPKKGDYLYIQLTVDKEDRFWGQLASDEMFEERAHLGTSVQHNNDIAGHAYSLRQSGTYVYTNDHYIGFIHPSERDREPRLGEYVEGRVIGVREDGVLYISLHPRSHEVLDDDARMIYEAIKRSSSQSIPYHDKSNPEDIKNYFGISKGQFKKAVGRLMKQNLVEQTDSTTKLIENE